MISTAEGRNPMRSKDRADFYACIDDLLNTPQVEQMKTIRHHPGVSCYAHCLGVSYGAYRLARRWRGDCRTAARAGLLHDLYLYDPRSLRSCRQCFVHPAAAARNAEALCGGLTPKERNSILAHMWPLSRRAPRCREAAAVCVADKLCSMAELLHLAGHLLGKVPGLLGQNVVKWG